LCFEPGKCTVVILTREAFYCLFKKRTVKFDAGKFNFGNRVCDEWNRLPSWVVNEESVIEFKANLDIILSSGILLDLNKLLLLDLN